MSDDVLDQMEKHERFLELIANGIAEQNAALECGWTFAQLRTKMHDPDFADMVKGARLQADGNVQHALYLRAITGNVTAQQFWLLNRQREQWTDIKKIEVKTDHTISVSAVKTAVEAARALLQEAGPAAIQSFHHKAIETQAHDA